MTDASNPADAADAADPAGSAVAEFAAVMRRLRAECPWKAEQTHRSLARFLLEESHETLEAIDVGNETGDWTHLREELGDLLLQVVFHAVIAEESGQFELADVAGDITEKMRRRNPHVFAPDQSSSGDGPRDAAEVNELWEQAKATEKGLDRLDHRQRVTEGLPPGLPALLYADKVLDRLARDGRAVAVEESDDIGERLLALVSEARGRGTDPEQALRDAVRRRL